MEKLDFGTVAVAIVVVFPFHAIIGDSLIKDKTMSLIKDKSR
jgi:hypothetical protein